MTFHNLYKSFANICEILSERIKAFMLEVHHDDDNEKELFKPTFLPIKSIFAVLLTAISCSFLYFLSSGYKYTEFQITQTDTLDDTGISSIAKLPDEINHDVSKPESVAVIKPMENDINYYDVEANINSNKETKEITENLKSSSKPVIKVKSENLSNEKVKSQIVHISDDLAFGITQSEQIIAAQSMNYRRADLGPVDNSVELSEPNSRNKKSPLNKPVIQNSTATITSTDAKTTKPSLNTENTDNPHLDNIVFSVRKSTIESHADDMLVITAYPSRRPDKRIEFLVNAKNFMAQTEPKLSADKIRHLKTILGNGLEIKLKQDMANNHLNSTDPIDQITHNADSPATYSTVASSKAMSDNNVLQQKHSSQNYDENSLKIITQILSQDL